MVEHWSPKPKVVGSSPTEPDMVLYIIECHKTILGRKVPTSFFYAKDKESAENYIVKLLDLGFVGQMIETKMNDSFKTQSSIIPYNSDEDAQKFIEKLID